MSTQLFLSQKFFLFQTLPTNIEKYLSELEGILSDLDKEKAKSIEAALKNKKVFQCVSAYYELAIYKFFKDKNFNPGFIPENEEKTSDIVINLPDQNKIIIECTVSSYEALNKSNLAAFQSYLGNICLAHKNLPANIELFNVQWNGRIGKKLEGEIQDFLQKLSNDFIDHKIFESFNKDGTINLSFSLKKRSGVDIPTRVFFGEGRSIPSLEREINRILKKKKKQLKNYNYPCLIAINNPFYRDKDSIKIDLIDFPKEISGLILTGTNFFPLSSIPNATFAEDKPKNHIMLYDFLSKKDEVTHSNVLYGGWEQQEELFFLPNPNANKPVPEDFLKHFKT